MNKYVHKRGEIPQLNHLNLVKKGQGVDSLFSVNSQSHGVNKSSTKCLDLSQIVVNPQVRHYFDPIKQQRLEASIAKQGILIPLIVRPRENDLFELVAGERRYRAAQNLGLTQVPVEIRHLDDDSAMEIALVENLQREDLNPLEETEGILGLLSLRLSLNKEDVQKLLYRAKNELDRKVTQNVLGSPIHVTMETVFNELGRMSWDSFVTSRLPLLNLPVDLLEVLRTGQIAYTKARAIARVKDEDSRKTLTARAINEQLSLSEIKARIKDLTTKSPDELPKIKISPKEKWKEINLMVNRSKIWEDETARGQLQSLMEQIESLIRAKS